MDLEDLRARLRVDISDLRRARTTVRDELRRMQSDASGDPVTIRLDTDTRDMEGDVRSARRRVQADADHNPIDVRTQVDTRQLYALAQSLRDLRTLYSASIGPIQTFSRTVASTAVVAGGASAALVGAVGLSGGLLAVVGAASQAAQALPAAATGMVALGLVSLTTKVAVSGVSKAMKDELAPITEHLSRNAQALVNRVGDLVPALTRARNAVQNAGFRGLAADIRPLAERYLPMLRFNAVVLATTFNSVLRGSIRSLQTSTAQWQIAYVLEQARQAVDGILPVLGRLPRLLVDIAAAGAPAFRQLAAAAGRALGGLMTRLQGALDSGALAASIQRGVNAIIALGRTVASVFSTIHSVVRAASAVFGGDLLGNISRVTANIAAFLRTAQGQEALRAVFAATVPVLRLLTQTAAALGPALVSIAPVVNSLAQAFLTALLPVIPVAARLAQQLGAALILVLPAVSNVAIAIGGALTQALTVIAPVLPQLLTALTSLLEPTGLLSAILTALAPVMPVLAQGFVNLVVPLAGAFVTAVNALAPQLPALATAMANFAAALAGGMADALVQMAPHLPALADSITKLFVALTPIAVSLMQLFADEWQAFATILPPIVDALAALAPAIIVVVAGIKAWSVAQALLNALLIANPIGLVITGLALLAVGITIAVQHWDKLKFAVDAAFVILGRGAEAVGRAFSTMGRGIVEIWRQIKDAGLGAISFILGAISSFLGGLSSMVGALGRLPGPLGAPFRAGKKVIDEARGAVETLKSRVDGLRSKAINVSVAIRARTVAVEGIATAVGPGGVRAAAYGGWLRGPWRGARADNLLIRANPEEFVIQAPAAQALERRRPGFLSGFVNRFHELGPLGGDQSGAWFGPRPPGFAQGGSVGYAQSRLRATDPLPYIWGGAGPGGFDCSGLVGYAYNLLAGLSPYVRRFTTASFPGFDGFRPGAVPGGFNVGVNPGVHMAGNLAGLPFEAQSTATGIHVGSGVTPVSAFAQQWHLPGIIASLTAAQVSSVLAQIRPAIIAGVIRDLGIRQADSGITLAPGLNAVYNGLGRPEPLAPKDGSDVAQAVAQGARAGVRDALSEWRARGDALADVIAPHLLDALDGGPRH